MSRRLLLVILVFVCHLALGQDEICACCSYTSLQFKNDFTSILPPDLIREGNIRTVTVYTQASDLSSTGITDKYLETKFKMDDSGQVVSKTEYNRRGKPHSLYEFERGADGRIVKQTFSYLDSLEQKGTKFPTSEIIDYSYDSNNRLAKSKERDIKGNIVEDKRSDYSVFEYDNKGRLVKETRQYYYGGSDIETATYTTTFNYTDNTHSGYSQTYENKRHFLTTKITYNKDWKPIKEEVYNNVISQPSSTTIYQYDSKNRLIYYDTKAGKGSASECPDGGTFKETYEYDDKGLLLRIHHTYQDKKCVMTFEYN